MNTAWAGFAKDPVGELEGLGWPGYDLDGECANLQKANVLIVGQVLVRLAENNGP
jgi:hypothetical protein